MERDSLVKKLTDTKDDKKVYKEYFCSCGTQVDYADNTHLKTHFLQCDSFKEEFKDLIAIISTFFKEIDPNHLLQFQIIFDIYMEKEKNSLGEGKNFFSNN